MLMCFAAVTVFMSCSKDTKDLIIGQWECTHSVKTDSEGTVTYDKDKGEIWEFKDNGVCIVDGHSTTYQLDEDHLIIMGGLVDATVSEISSSKLVIDYKEIDGDLKHLEFAKK